MAGDWQGTWQGTVSAVSAGLSSVVGVSVPIVLVKTQRFRDTYPEFYSWIK